MPRQLKLYKYTSWYLTRKKNKFREVSLICFKLPAISFRRVLNNFFITVFTGLGFTLMTFSVGTVLKKSLITKKRRNLITIGDFALLVAQRLKTNGFRLFSTLAIDGTRVRNSPKTLARTVIEAFEKFELFFITAFTFRYSAHGWCRLPKMRRK